MVFFIANPAIERVENLARIIRRLPEDFEGKIIHLSGNGHVVHVSTCHRRFDLRMRFGDAVAEVAELDGFCTHRSHWVARKEISDVYSVNGRPHLLLSNGDEVPVSRKYQPELEEMGII